jgi:hypothetical protein
MPAEATTVRTSTALAAGMMLFRTAIMWIISLPGISIIRVAPIVMSTARLASLKRPQAETTILRPGTFLPTQERA